MSVRNKNALKRSRLTAALFTALIPFAGAAIAQESTQQQADAPRATELDKVVVTGSLIPQTQLETFTPVTVITAEDIQARGFNSVSDVLQQSSFSTGGVQGSQSSASFTQGAETLSMFGLPPGYVKYLIDGRPMANYPALYNGSDTFNNISGIPIDLIDRIEILPGGQSSLYGSDAIAGVINVILKKQMDGAAFSLRGGWYSEGGGDSVRFSLADGFSSEDGRLNALVGFQYEDRDPIWGYQRDLTKQYNTNGTSAPLASRDYLVFSPFTSYAFLDPANCANVTGQFGGTEGLQTRPGFGDENYCGSFYTPGYRTLRNSKEATQVYGHVTFDVNDNLQLYADALYSREHVKYHVGSNYTWWGTGVEWGYYYDPDYDNFFNLQRAFSPEDMGPGGFASTMSKDSSTAYHLTFGAKGTFGASAWDYDVGFTRTEYKLDENGFVRWADAINQYFQDRVLGPQLGMDPYYGAYPVFQPDYAAFYQPMSPEDFKSFTGYALSKSRTWDNMLRAQVTNGSLFTLPGGEAGLAVVVEAGTQSWDYNPDPGYLDGSVWGTTAVSGGGERDRYAVTSELRLPLWDMLTVSLSGRYDAFEASGRTIDKPTYSVGLEFRPLETLLFRGKYGTAFRAPTLSDLYQGVSGFYTFVVDYYGCSQLGIAPEDAADLCPAALSNRQVFGTQSGSLDLEPINADVWSVGTVWAPLDRLSLTLDYHNWDIRDEVTQQSANGLTLQEYRCRTGLDDINSPLCVNTLSQITRNVNGAITEIFTPKINVSRQQLEAFTFGVNYGIDIGSFGDLSFRGNYTQKISHEYQQYEGDDLIDLLNDPTWSTDPKRKADLSASWSKGNWSTTLYANWIDKTPNYRASVVGYDNPLSGKLGSFTLYNASVSYSPLPGLDLSLLVNNVFNKMPPFDATYPGSTGAPYNSSNFNVFGRAIYMEMKYAFGAK
ncbi:TonB-dependent receptor plug domain-containing protein [Pseudoxanthomonas mexicana]